MTQPTLRELRDKRDVWPIIEANIPHVLEDIHQHLNSVLDEPDLVKHLERKFRKGEAEHGGAWLASNADPSWLIPEAAEEILDFILYQCMYLVLLNTRDDA